MSENPASVEDVEPWQDSIKRQVKLLYCEKWASEYAPVTMTGALILFALIGFTGDDWELSFYCLGISVVVAPLELHQRSERLRNLAAQMRLKDWAESPTNRGLVYLALAFVGMIVTAIWGMSLAFLSLLFLVERGLFYLAIPYCSANVGDGAGIYDQLDLAFDGSFTDVTPTGGVDYLDMDDGSGDGIPDARVDVTAIEYDPTPRNLPGEGQRAELPAEAFSIPSIPSSNIGEVGTVIPQQDTSFDDYTAPASVL